MKEIYITPEDNLQNILDSLDGPATIYLSAGIYRQKTEIKTDGVTLVGAGRETTIITYDDYARKQHADGREYNTFRTYTLCVSGENVTLKKLTVENSNTDPQTVGQCVALSVNAKRFYAENVELKSTQDTLFMAPFPDDLVVRYRGFIPENQLYMDGCAVHLFKNCRIAGRWTLFSAGRRRILRTASLYRFTKSGARALLPRPATTLCRAGAFTLSTAVL